jgi:hypothetical protein
MGLQAGTRLQLVSSPSLKISAVGYRILTRCKELARQLASERTGSTLDQGGYRAFLFFQAHISACSNLISSRSSCLRCRRPRRAGKLRGRPVLRYREISTPLPWVFPTPRNVNVPKASQTTHHPPPWQNRAGPSHQHARPPRCALRVPGTGLPVAPGRRPQPPARAAGPAAAAERPPGALPRGAHGAHDVQRGGGEG